MLRTYQASKSTPDFIKYKQTRAKARALVRLAKKRSWNSYVADINEPVSPSTMWRDIKRLAGKFTFHPISQLKSDATTLSDPQDISELFASHFSAVSADSNYDSHFLNLKSQAEAHHISFNSEDTSLSYNPPISPFELRSTIHNNLRNAFPGVDNIHVSMLKHLHSNSFDNLVSLFNVILLQGSYPPPGNWLLFPYPETL